MRPGLSISSRLRWPFIRDALQRFQPASVVEVGCGRGALIKFLADQREYRGYEPDSLSFGVARSMALHRADVDVLNTPLPEISDRQFDALVAFEVLEHLASDGAALKTWSEWVVDGGLLIISVPAHSDRFGPSDVRAGHFRRYERQELARLLRSAGFEPLEIYSWGMPLGYLLEAVRNTVARRTAAGMSIEERTATSGRWLQVPASLSWLIGTLIWPFMWLQQPFRHTGLGIGFVAVARRSGS